MLRKFCENPTADPDDDYCGTRKRPDSLVVDEWMKKMDGTFAHDGHLTHFVAENLEQKIKSSSPMTRSKTNTPSSSLLPKNFMLPSHLTQVDSNVLNDIEIEAQYLAASVDNLTENLCNLLHSVSIPIA